VVTVRFLKRLVLVCLAISKIGYANVNDQGVAVTIIKTTALYEIQLEAKNVSLARILEEISQKTAVKIHYSVLPLKPITATCAASDIEVLFRCLLGQTVDFVFHYHPVERTKELKLIPKDIWILGSSLAFCSLNNMDRKKASSNKSKGSKQENKTQRQLDDLFSQAKEGDSFQRRQAIIKLSERAPLHLEVMTDFLKQALIDEEPNIRAQALSSWVKRKEGNAEELIEGFLQDEAVEVRMMAVSLVSTKELLEFALGDSDRVVKKFAKNKLDKLKDKLGVDNE